LQEHSDDLQCQWRGNNYMWTLGFAAENFSILGKKTQQIQLEVTVVVFAPKNYAKF
jgi:hypothetical protein